MILMIYLLELSISHQLCQICLIPRIEHTLYYNPSMEEDPAQSRQSAKLSRQSSELGIPHPLTCRRVYTPPPPSWGEGGKLACGRGGGGPIPTRGQTLWYSIYISYFVRSHLIRNLKNKFQVLMGIRSAKSTVSYNYFYVLLKHIQNIIMKHLLSLVAILLFWS